MEFHSNERESIIDYFFLDFQSGMIIEKLNRNTHVYQYVVNSMVSQFYFDEFERIHRMI